MKVYIVLNDKTNEIKGVYNDKNHAKQSLSLYDRIETQTVLFGHFTQKMEPFYDPSSGLLDGRILSPAKPS